MSIYPSLRGQMKLHRILVEAVIGCVEQIFKEGKYADKAIERVLKQNKKWGSRDRAFVAEYTYEFVRWWRLIQFVSETEGRQDKGALWRMFGVLYLLREGELPQWNEFKHMDQEAINARYDEAQKDPRIMESVPDWLYELGKTELPEKWDEELKALNEQAPLVIRANTLKINASQLSRRLADHGIATHTVDGVTEALVLEKRTNLFSMDEFREGLFEIQDTSSQQVASFLEVEPGMRVVDACAGAGGKSLHIAALMQNKGRVIAMDVEQWKLDELMRRAKRAGVGNIETRLIDSSKVIKRLEGSADRLLLDVPCSGLGVLRRNPDAKWKLKPEFIDEIRKTQQHIIRTYSAMLKPGGKMVYATCSILPSEDEMQVAQFIKDYPAYKLIKEQRISPVSGSDGFYMALLHKGL